MRAELIQAQYERLDAIAVHFGRQAQQTAQLRRAIQLGTGNLRQGGWEGAAANAFYSEADGEVLPAIGRLLEALQTARTTMLQIKAILRQAEEDAAAPFRVRGAGVEGDAVASGDLPVRPPPPEDSEGLRKKLYEEIVDQLKDQIADNYEYTVADLHLEQLSLAELRVLKAYLGDGKLPLSDTLNQVELLQKYWGYDNAKMLSALREIYYPKVLNPFLQDAQQIDESIYEVTRARSGITESQAALARALLILSKQGNDYCDPILRTEFPPGYGNPKDAQDRTSEFGFDHVIAALDGHFHRLPNGLPMTSPEGFALFVLGTDIGKISSSDAVTWQGDLGAVVSQDLLASFGKTLTAEDGYAVEMPLQDFNGDMFGNAIIRQDLVQSDGQDLARVLGDAFDPNSNVARQRYQLFAEQIGLTYDAKGTITPISKDSFVSTNLGTVKNFGLGLYLPEVAPYLDDPVPVIDPLQQTDRIAEDNMNRFLDQIQQGLWSELRPKPVK